MDEYTPRHFDVLRIRYYCNELYARGVAILTHSASYKVNDPTALANLELMELVEHTYAFNTLFLLKHPNEIELAEHVNLFLEMTEELFAGYGFFEETLKPWHQCAQELFASLTGNRISEHVK